MFTKLLLLCCVFLILATDYVTIHERIQSNADFTYQSQVGLTSDKKLKIGCYVTNNSDTTSLAIRWDDCGILAQAFYQLGPGHTQSKEYMAQEPYLLDHSEIRYGNNMQYSNDARCYIDGQGRSKTAQTRVTEYERSNEDGAKLFKIEVASTLNEDARSADLTFRVVGGSSLILPSRIGNAINSFNESKEDGRWEILRTASLTQIDIREPSDRDVISEWLNNTPKVKSVGGSSDLVVLKNKIRASNEIPLSMAGANWSVEKVYLIAFTPNRPGAFGFTADVYLPR